MGSHLHHFCIPQQVIFIDVKSNKNVEIHATILYPDQPIPPDGSQICIEYDADGQLSRIHPCKEVQVFSYQLICETESKKLYIFGNASDTFFSRESKETLPTVDQLLTELSTR
jgi:hypothetical protein